MTVQFMQWGKRSALHCARQGTASFAPA